MPEIFIRHHDWDFIVDGLFYSKKWVIAHHQHFIFLHSLKPMLAQVMRAAWKDRMVLVCEAHVCTSLVLCCHFQCPLAAGVARVHHLTTRLLSYVTYEQANPRHPKTLLGGAHTHTHTCMISHSSHTPLTLNLSPLPFSVCIPAHMHTHTHRWCNTYMC